MALNNGNELRNNRRERGEMVGTRIKEYLKDHGIKMSFVAEKIGVSSVRMAQILSAKNISCVTYYKICKALEMPLETFIDED